MTTQSDNWDRRWPAPAKLNLMLRIVGRRPDGYHLLQTVFQFIDRCDWLSFQPRPDGHIVRSNEIAGVPENEDLTIRAAGLLKKDSGYRGGVTICVEKNLPLGGGLGGGSSDAATVLVALNELWGLGFSIEQLSALGLNLGADVPIFVHGCSAWAEGVGEKFQAIDLAEPWYVIIVPDCQVSTQKVFASDALTRNNKPITIKDFTSVFSGNDCLSVVRAMYSPVHDALEQLGRFGDAKLTGTGACVFSEFDSADRARQVAEKLRHDWDVFVARGLNVSPLRELLVAM